MSRNELLKKARAGILFNTEMVKAILDGRKTQTRRILKKPFEVHPNGYITKSKGNLRLCPYVSQYKVGDILYVRETFKYGSWRNGRQQVAIDYKADKNPKKSKWIIYKGNYQKLLKQNIDDCRKANLINLDSGMRWNKEQEKSDLFDESYEWEVGNSPCRWRPSIHMPKEYARIFLKVTNVRIKRLQDISLDDMLKEGINHIQKYKEGSVVKPKNQIKREWINLWNSTAKDGYKWKDNPYVFVYEFEVIKL